MTIKLRILGIFISALSLSCASKYFSKIATENGSQVYALNYFPTAPHPPSHDDQWHCIRFYEDCFGSSPLALEAQWSGDTSCTLRCKRVIPRDYVNGHDRAYEISPRLFLNYGQPMVRLLDRPIRVLEYSLNTSDVAVLDALHILWDHLQSLTYYNQGSVDGCGFYYETYSSSGLQRRLSVSTPQGPQYGSDIVALMSNVEVFLEMSQMEPGLYRIFRGRMYSLQGQELYRNIDDVRTYLRDAVVKAKANEKGVISFQPIPCPDDGKMSSQEILVNEGCFLKKQPVACKAWQSYGE